MSGRLAQKGKFFGVRERLSLPDCLLILRSKMTTLLRLLGADESIGRFFCGRSSPRSVRIIDEAACGWRPSSGQFAEREGDFGAMPALNPQQAFHLAGAEAPPEISSWIFLPRVVVPTAPDMLTYTEK